MAKRSFYNLFMVCGLISFLFLSPPSPVHSDTLQQENKQVSATGYFCDNNGNCNGSFSLNFNPNGGPVSGSFYIQIPILDENGVAIGIETFKGSLVGTFAGGDGGQVSGTLTQATQNLHFTEVCDRCVNGTTSRDGKTWQGNLHANGNGSGWIEQNSFPWKVTFSADEFQTAINQANGNEASSNITETPILTSTQTEISVVGIPLDQFPEVRKAIAASPDLNTATQGILNQDAALIVRDNNNQFYAVSDGGKSVPLPASLSNMLATSNQFAILGNDNLLASSEHSSIRGSINGGGDFVMLQKMPSDLKNHDYTMLANNCSGNTCNPVMIINSPASSTKVNSKYMTCPINRPTAQTGGVYFISSPSGRIESSEHGCIRGTINGGGDFIYEYPQMVMANHQINAAKLQSADNPQVYLGLQVQDTENGAVILMVEAGSPAETAGLQMGDVINQISGTPLNAQQTLANLASSFKPGDVLQVGYKRESKQTSTTLTVAEYGDPFITTPAAVMIIPEDSELVIDIGFNGVTGVLVLSGSVKVGELTTKTSTMVGAGQAIIVVPGEAIGAPFAVDDSQINKWWDNPSASESVSPTAGAPNDAPTSATPVQSFKGYKDFNPLPNADEESLYILFSIGLGILYLVILVILIFRKEKR